MDSGATAGTLDEPPEQNQGLNSIFGTLENDKPSSIDELASKAFESPSTASVEDMNQSDSHNKMLQSAETSKSVRLRKRCCAPGCKNTNLSSRMFGLPNIKVKGGDLVNKVELERLKQWVKNIGNKEITVTDPFNVSQQFFLCSEHFEKKNHITAKGYLTRTAYPTIFKEPSISNDDFSLYEARLKLILEQKTGLNNMFKESGNDMPSAIDKLALKAIQCPSTANVEDIYQLDSYNKRAHEMPLPIDELASQAIESPSTASVEDINQCDSRNKKSQSAETSKNLRMRKRCCAPGCKNTNLTSKMFCLPNIKVKGGDLVNKVELERLKQWVKNIGNKEITVADPFNVSQQFFLCSEHFEKKNHITAKGYLTRTAYPTIFKEPSMSNDDFSLYEARLKLILDEMRGQNNVGSSPSEREQISNNQDENLRSSEHTSDCQDDNLLSLELTCEGIQEDCFSTSQNESLPKTPSNSRLRNRCCAPGCESSNLNRKMFGFPNIEDGVIAEEINRFKTWVQNTGNDKITYIHPYNVHCRFFLCADHFENCHFTQKGCLKKTAFPTIFKQPSLTDRKFSLYETKLTLILEQTRDENDIDDVFSLYCCFNFEEKMMSLEWRVCENCKEKHMKLKSAPVKCTHGVHCDDFTISNNMDPGTVPEELSGLPFIEEQLIARVHPLVSVFKLKGSQLGYSGNVINFSQDVAKFAAVLPKKVKDLTSIITIRFSSEKVQYRDFQVRAGVVWKALIWLKANNPFYSDVQISETNIRELPEDGNLYEDIVGVHCDVEEEDFLPSNDDIRGIHHSSVPVTITPNQNEQINSCLNCLKCLRNRSTNSKLLDM